MAVRRITTETERTCCIIVIVAFICPKQNIFSTRATVYNQCPVIVVATVATLIEAMLVAFLFPIHDSLPASFDAI